MNNGIEVNELSCQPLTLFKNNSLELRGIEREEAPVQSS